MLWRRLFKHPSQPRAQRASSPLSHVQAPSAQYPTPFDAIHSLLVAHSLPSKPGAADDGGWLTFYASSGVRKGVIEVAGNSLNFCKEKIDLPSVLRDIGMEALAPRARPGPNGDRTAWTLESATADDFASIIDISFARVLAGSGLGDAYELSGERQG